MPPRLAVSLLTLLAALAPAVPARAAIFPAEPVDGPSPGVRAVLGVDLARDGTGGVLYTKDDGGVPHLFLSRFYEGQWHPPERVDAGIETATTDAALGAGDAKRLAIAFVSGGRVFGAVANGGPVVPVPAPVLLYADPDPLRAASGPSVDLGINGTAYAAFTVPGAGGSDVRAARLDGPTWSLVPQPLDINVDQPAGDGKGRPRVAVSAEGNAVVAWGEGHPDGRPRVYGRRVTGLNVSLAPQEISVPDFEGAFGGAADSPDIDIEDDNSYAWAVWRQDIGGVSRVLARRLVGSLFEAPVAVDAGGAAVNPAIDMTGRGVGTAAAAAAGTGGVLAAQLELDAFKPALRLDSAPSSDDPAPALAVGEKETTLVAWRRAADATSASVVGRYREAGKGYDPEVALSNPALGGVPAGPVVAAADRSGNAVAAFLQGDATGRWVAAAVFDRLPGAPVGQSTTKYQRRSRPVLKWRAGSEIWGPQRYRVEIDGAPVGETPATTYMVPQPLDDGPHRWRVVAIDRRNQEKPGRPRYVRVDATPPLLRLRISGVRKRGRSLRFRISARDERGLKRVSLDFGDGSPVTTASIVVHRYAHKGTFTAIARATDTAGNVARTATQLKIRK